MEPVRDRARARGEGAPAGAGLEQPLVPSWQAPTRSPGVSPPRRDLARRVEPRAGSHRARRRLDGPPAVHNTTRSGAFTLHGRRLTPPHHGATLPPVEWLEPEEEKVAFVDAERLYRVLDAARNAPNLYQSATDKFPAPAEDDAVNAESALDLDAYDLLLADEFIDVPQDLRNAIDKFRHLESDGERTRESLVQVYRRLKLLAVQMRAADKGIERGGFLKAKVQKWDEQTKRDELQNQIDDLTLTRRRLESDLEKAGTLLRNLLDRVYRDQGLRDAHWIWERPVRLTHHGRFLLDYLADMNPANFRGRSLAEIIEIGPSLA